MRLPAHLLFCHLHFVPLVSHFLYPLHLVLCLPQLVFWCHLVSAFATLASGPWCHSIEMVWVQTGWALVPVQQGCGLGRIWTCFFGRRVVLGHVAHSVAYVIAAAALGQRWTRGASIVAGVRVDMLALLLACVDATGGVFGECRPVGIGSGGGDGSGRGEKGPCCLYSGCCSGGCLALAPRHHSTFALVGVFT